MLKYWRCQRLRIEMVQLESCCCWHWKMRKIADTVPDYNNCMNGLTNQFISACNTSPDACPPGCLCFPPIDITQMNNYKLSDKKEKTSAHKPFVVNLINTMFIHCIDMELNAEATRLLIITSASSSSTQLFGLIYSNIQSSICWRCSCLVPKELSARDKTWFLWCPSVQDAVL